MDFLKLATTLKILRIFAIFFAKIRFIVEEKLCSCSKLAFVQILMSRINLIITIIIGQLTLIRCYIYAKRKLTKFLCKVPLALSKPVLSYAADPAIIEIREMVYSDWLYLIVFIGIFRSSFLMNCG